MPSIAAPRKPLADIGFHDVLALILSLDSEWSRHCRTPGSFPPTDNHVQFRQSCRNFADGINDSFLDWLKANAGKPGSDGWIDPRLYNPLGYFPLGHADDAFLLLIDDLAPAHDLTVQIHRRIEDVALGYCLKMEDLKSTATWRRGRRKARLKDHPEASALGDLMERFDPECGPQPPHLRATTEPPGKDFWGCQATHRRFPFLVFTRLRMDGVGAVTQYLLMQQALYKAMAVCVCDTLAELRGLTASRRLSRSVLVPQDISEIQISFLDLAGVEETGVLFFCRNLSVAMSVVAQFRKLTYADAFRQEEELQRRIVTDDCYKLVVEQWKEWKKRSDVGLRPRADVDFVRGTHLFRWSNSSVFVSPFALLDSPGLCGGSVYGELACELAPGHHERMQEILDGAPPPAPVRNPGWCMFPVGDYDISDVVGGRPLSKACRTGFRGAVRPLVKSADLLRHWLHVARQSIAARNGPKYSGRSCTEMSLRLEVPVPPLASRSKSDWHCSVLMDVLTEIQARLGEDSSNQPQTRRSATPLSTAAFRAARDKSKLPRHLRQTIESLYQVFHSFLADSHRFDLVLDLYDVFATLHRLVTESLASTGRSCGDEQVLDTNRVHRIELVVSAIENALHHRMAKVFANSSPLDMAVDFRGGMNQMILGAAAPMICSLGLLRKCVVEPALRRRFKNNPTGLRRQHPQSHVGVVSRISLLSGMQYCPLDLDYGNADDLQLAHYEADVSHILHIPTYVDCFHEAGHMVFRTIFRPDSDEEFEPSWCETLWSTSQDQEKLAGTVHRLNEIFALLFGQVFVFGTDREAAFIHHLTAFCQSLDSVGRNQRLSQTSDLSAAQAGVLDGIHRFAEIMFRLAAVRGLLPPNPCISVDQWIAQGPPLPILDDARRDFQHLFDRALRYHPCFEAVWQGSELETIVYDHAMRVFEEGYQSVRDYLPWVRNAVATVYSRYLSDATLPSEADPAAFDHIFQESFDTGFPVLRCRIPNLPPSDSTTAPVWCEPKDACVDPLFVISRLLAKHIKGMQAKNGEHLTRQRLWRARDERDRSLDEPATHTRAQEDDPPIVHEYLIDQGAAALFCPVPEARRRRALQQIVIRKTLRDVAATFHGRRLFRIVYDTLVRPD